LIPLEKKFVLNNIGIFGTTPPIFEAEREVFILLIKFFEKLEAKNLSFDERNT